VFAGIGNSMRHDDGAGPAAASRAAELARARLAASNGAPPGGRELVTLLASPLTEPLDLLDNWQETDLAVVVDAVRSGDAPGTVTVTWLERPGDGPRPLTGNRPSTHGLGVADVYRLAHEIGIAPRRVAVVGIEGDDFSHGEGLTPAVEEGATKAAALLLQIAEDALG
jgi:hydrogenase maturation protease